MPALGRLLAAIPIVVVLALVFLFIPTTVFAASSTLTTPADNNTSFSCTTPLAVAGNSTDHTDVVDVSIVTTSGYGGPNNGQVGSVSLTPNGTTGDFSGNITSIAGWPATSGWYAVFAIPQDGSGQFSNVNYIECSAATATPTSTSTPTATPTNTSTPTSTPTTAPTNTPIPVTCTNPGGTFDSAKGSQYEYIDSINDYTNCLVDIAIATQIAIPTNTPIPTSTPIPPTATPTLGATPAAVYASTGCNPYDPKSMYQDCVIHDAEVRSDSYIFWTIPLILVAILAFGVTSRGRFWKR